jgi:Leucine-rich repeat (LRR) protein
LKALDAFIFGYSNQLTHLNLASNNLRNLNENCFFDLLNLNNLRLSSNQINSTDFLKSNKNDLYALKNLELEENEIVLINETHLKSYLSFLNLNSNPIKSIHENAFMGLKFPIL